MEEDNKLSKNKFALLADDSSSSNDDDEDDIVEKKNKTLTITSSTWMKPASFSITQRSEKVPFMLKSAQFNLPVNSSIKTTSIIDDDDDL